MHVCGGHIQVCILLHRKTLKVIIFSLRTPYWGDDDDIMNIEIRRDFVYTDCLKEGRKRKFNP